MKKQVKSKKKLKKFTVTVNVNINGQFNVMAKTEDEALDKAKDLVDVDDAHYGIAGPCVDYDYEVES